MKGNILSKKVIMLISAVGITGILLTGCSSKTDNNGQANAATQQNNGSSSQGKSGTRGNFAANSEERKKQMEDSVNSLVTDGTLSKDQGTKVLEALTSFTQRPSGQGQNNQNGQQNSGNNSNAQNSQNGNNQNNNSNGNQQGQNRQGRGNFNPLSKLVSDGTITQDQADKVMAKIRGNMPQRQNNNNGNTNNNSNTNNSNSNNGTSSS